MAGRTSASKRRAIPYHNTQQTYMKLVTSDICESCKSQCSLGIQYLEQMRTPGAVGKGVPCILTKYKT